jgi:hypothetical protein
LSIGLRARYSTLIYNADNRDDPDWWVMKVLCLLLALSEEKQAEGECRRNIP